MGQSAQRSGHSRAGFSAIGGFCRTKGNLRLGLAFPALVCYTVSAGSEARSLPRGKWKLHRAARAHSPPGVTQMSCSTCQHLDGSPNVEYLTAEGSCTFGCGNVVSSNEDGICWTCRDHSANHVDCPDCGAEWEDWGGQWEQTVQSKRQHLSS